MKSSYAAALVLAAGFVAVGLLDYALFASGYERLAIAAWILGYGALVVVVWYRWIRPLEFTGPTE